MKKPSHKTQAAPKSRVVPQSSVTVTYGENNVQSLMLTKSWTLQEKMEHLRKKFPSFTKVEIDGELYTRNARGRITHVEVAQLAEV